VLHILVDIILFAENVGNLKLGVNLFFFGLLKILS